MLRAMTEPCYAAHERIALRRMHVAETGPDAETVSLYENLTRRLIEAYPDSGPLRSMALRKLSESLDDILDHAALVRMRSPQIPHLTPVVSPVNRDDATTPGQDQDESERVTGQ